MLLVVVEIITYMQVLAISKPTALTLETFVTMITALMLNWFRILYVKSQARNMIYHQQRITSRKDKSVSGHHNFKKVWLFYKHTRSTRVTDFQLHECKKNLLYATNSFVRVIKRWWAGSVTHPEKIMRSNLASRKELQKSQLLIKSKMQKENLKPNRKQLLNSCCQTSTKKCQMSKKKKRFMKVHFRLAGTYSKSCNLLLIPKNKNTLQSVIV